MAPQDSGSHIKILPAALPPMALQHHMQYFWSKKVSLYYQKGYISYGPLQCLDIKNHQEYLQSFKQILLAPQVSSRDLRNIDYRTIASLAFSNHVENPPTSALHSGTKGERERDLEMEETT